ncbi:hypothetical protein Stsp02_61120 [Streptomyces sp. NBRC 14336]|nr:hypothetical protein Stsp02_61120 [Streptomyces sp. NBRC 14336]
MNRPGAADCHRPVGRTGRTAGRTGRAVAVARVPGSAPAVREGQPFATGPWADPAGRPGAAVCHRPVGWTGRAVAVARVPGSAPAVREGQPCAVGPSRPGGVG